MRAPPYDQLLEFFFLPSFTGISIIHIRKVLYYIIFGIIDKQEEENRLSVPLLAVY